MNGIRRNVKGNDGRGPKRLLDRAREVMRLKHYSIRIKSPLDF